MTRVAPTPADLTHERLGDAFERAQNRYDTARRVAVLVDEFLRDDMIVGRQVLDVGCGLGQFSARLAERGADVTACDIGEGLVRRTRERVGCRAEVADAMGLIDHFGPERFDVVLSSEMIEHTPDPTAAVRQMAGVLRPGGHLVLSTPNIVWWPVVRGATRLKLRPFDGPERFSSRRSLRRCVEACGVRILRERGLHLLPFQLGLHGLSTWCDRHLQLLRGLMINLCVLGRK